MTNRPVHLLLLSLLLACGLGAAAQSLPSSCAAIQPLPGQMRSATVLITADQLLALKNVNQNSLILAQPETPSEVVCPTGLTFLYRPGAKPFAAAKAQFGVYYASNHLIAYSNDSAAELGLTGRQQLLHTEFLAEVPADLHQAVNLPLVLGRLNAGAMTGGSGDLQVVVDYFLYTLPN